MTRSRADHLHERITRHVGQKIRHTRQRREMTREQVANALGVEPDQIDRIERGLDPVTAAHLYLLAQALNVESIHSFFRGLELDLARPITLSGAEKDTAGPSPDETLALVKAFFELSPADRARAIGLIENWT